jgi:hypothetical protein
MEYKLYLRREVIQFLRACRPRDRDLLFAELDSLALNPHRAGDYRDRDDTGREVEVIVFQRFAIHYWPDHAVKELKVVDLLPAD